MKKHWGSKKFKEGAKSTIQKTSCEQEMTAQKFPFEDTLNGPPPETD